MEQTFPPASLGGIPRELRDMINKHVVKEEKVIYQKVVIAEHESVSFITFTIKGFGNVCRQFRAEYADTLNKHIQHLTTVGDINGNKLFDSDRYPRGFRSKISLVRKNNSPLWQCHPLLPSLRRLRLLSSFNCIVFEAFQGHYIVAPDTEQKLSVSFEFPLSREARKSVRHSEAAMYDQIFSAAKLETLMRTHTNNINDITQIDNKRFKPSLKAIIAVHDSTGRRKQTPNTFLDAFRALCDTMDATIIKAIWPAACCHDQKCYCFFTKQVHTYLKSTLLRCRGYPNTLYAFDNYTKLDLRDNPTLHQLNAVSLAKHHRNQFRGSWVTGCNRNFELFSEAGSCYMDCKKCTTPHAMDGSDL